jgi:hypothetical protein
MSENTKEKRDKGTKKSKILLRYILSKVILNEKFNQIKKCGVKKN